MWDDIDPLPEAPDEPPHSQSEWKELTWWQTLVMFLFCITVVIVGGELLMMYLDAVAQSYVESARP